ncbi:MAG TPA: DUF3006 domain-containing protein [Candidatus Merdenecus merdavium]|nr:DUF3006 domain-containing protein [Candidatus Merdenecus merdavium]
MKLVIDRIEGELAICQQEDRKMMEIPLQDLPFGVKEGDILLYSKDGIKVLADERKALEEELKKRMDRLFE